MALSGTARSTGNTTGAQPSGNFAASSWAVLVVSADNAETGGVANSAFSVSDTKSNTWTRRISPLYDPISTNQGVEGAIFTTPQDGGALTTSDTITITFGTSPPVLVHALWEVTTSGTISYVTGGVNTGSATASPTVTTGSITSGDMVIGGLFNERGTDQVVTGDSDTSNGNWSTQQTTGSGSLQAGQTVSTQWKTTTGTGTQTYNPTLGTSSDVILGYIVLNEAAANVTVTPSTASLTLTTFAPTVTATAGVTVTPDTASLTLTTFAPTVTATTNVLVTPTTATLNLTTFAPTVTATGAFAQGVGGFMIIG